MKNRLRGLNETVRAIVDDALQDSYNKGYEDGKASAASSIVEGESIMHEGLFLTKVSREAREGDYVRVKHESGYCFKPNKIYGPVDNGFVKADPSTSGHSHEKVLVYNSTYNRNLQTVEVFEVVSDSPPQIIKSANQQRAELIEKAKGFIKSKEFVGSVTKRLGINATDAICDVQFIVNSKKSTVVCVLKKQISRGFFGKGIAKCHPNDVFNADIGKAIALGRALGISIPGEFLQAVQPNDFVIGQVVKAKNLKNNGKPLVETIKGFETIWGKECLKLMERGYFAIKSGDGEEYNPIVIDDTNAQYEAHQ